MNLTGRTLTLNGGTGTLSGQIGVIMASGAVFNNNSTFDLNNDGGFASLSLIFGQRDVQQHWPSAEDDDGQYGRTQYCGAVHQYRCGAGAGSDVSP